MSVFFNLTRPRVKWFFKCSTYRGLIHCVRFISISWVMAIFPFVQISQRNRIIHIITINVPMNMQRIGLVIIFILSCCLVLRPNDVVFHHPNKMSSHIFKISNIVQYAQRVRINSNINITNIEFIYISIQKPLQLKICSRLNPIHCHTLKV